MISSIIWIGSMVYAMNMDIRYWLYAIMKVTISIILGISLFFGVIPNASSSEDDPLKIIKLSDEIRFPREGFQVDVKIVSTGEATEERTYRVISKGNENSIVATLLPKIDYGQNILMKGRDMWIFLPDISQPLRLSASQRLTGQVANGDIARANFGSDYNPTILRKEVIEGVEYWVMELVAVDRSVTYNKVLYWVNTKNHHPLKAEFISMSGKTLKSCVYLDFKLTLGKVRPTKLIMTDPLKGQTSTLSYTSMKLRDTPEKLFTKDYLKKLIEEL